MPGKTKIQKMAERQDGNYQPPIIKRPRKKRPIPPWTGGSKSQ